MRISESRSVQQGRRRETRAATLARLELASEIHDRVIPPLQGATIALEGGGLSESELRALAREISDALADLRAALAVEHRGIVGTQRRLDEVVARVRPDHPRLAVQLIGDTTATVSADLEPLVHHFLTEAIANTERHARPSCVDVAVSHTQRTLCVEISNDRVMASTRPAGIGLRLVVEHALQHGALVDYGETSPGRWRTRLVLPIEPDEQDVAA